MDDRLSPFRFSQNISWNSPLFYYIFHNEYEKFVAAIRYLITMTLRTANHYQQQFTVWHFYTVRPLSPGDSSPGYVSCIWRIWSCNIFYVICVRSCSYILSWFFARFLFSHLAYLLIFCRFSSIYTKIKLHTLYTHTYIYIYISWEPFPPMRKDVSYIVIWFWPCPLYLRS